jgi:hypothetical protein
VSLTHLRREVLAANRASVPSGLVVLSFGNASGVDRTAGVMVTKPSGGPFGEAIRAMAFQAMPLRPDAPPVDDAQLDRQLHRKHGPGADHGQPR